MLKNLKIKNFAIIDDVEIEFNSGFSVITGETGAGKSIIIEALNLILGSRASASMVKKSASKSFIFGLFEINDIIAKYLDDQEIDFSDELELTRVITSNGKSTFKVNGQIVPLSIIKEIRDLLIEIKKQSDDEISNDKNFAIKLLDGVSKITDEGQFVKYQDHYKNYVALNKKLKEITNKNNEVDIDHIKKEISRLHSLDIKDGEYEELIQKSKFFNDSEAIMKLGSDIRKLLDGSVDSLYALKQNMHKISEYGYDYKEGIDSIVIQFEEYMNNFNVDVEEVSESEINFIEERIFEIKKCFNKYGGDFVSYKSSLEDMEETVYNIENSAIVIDELNREINLSVNSMKECLVDIDKFRDKWASFISNEVNDILSRLYMEEALIKFDSIIADYSINGNRDYSILISTNGNEYLPINMFASGGEKSRVMLAIKSVVASKLNLSTIIFDEIDTGVSGRVAKAMGEVMKEMSKFTQVISITHLPQVASIADYHLKVEKSLQDEEVVSDVKYLNDQDRVNEIASMLSGDIVSEEALSNANKLLNEG